LDVWIEEGIEAQDVKNAVPFFIVLVWRHKNLNKNSCKKLKREINCQSLLFYIYNLKMKWVRKVIIFL